MGLRRRRRAVFNEIHVDYTVYALPLETKRPDATQVGPFFSYYLYKKSHLIFKSEFLIVLQFKVAKVEANNELT
jgi:hypothetical protein